MNWKNIFIPRKLWQAMQIEARTLAVLSRYGLPDVMPQFLGGLGDELLLTCVAHELKKRHPDFRIWQVSSAEELLRHNPDYAHVFPMDHWYLRYSNILNTQRVRLRYSEVAIPGEQEKAPEDHILALLCRAAHIRGKIDLRPYYYQTELEKRQGRIAEQQIAIQSIGDFTHETWMRNKLWFHDKFQEVVDRINLIHPEIKIVQLGLIKDNPLRGVIDMRGKTSLRGTADILRQSLCFIGTQGLLAHLARAVECRSVIIFGGREHSWQSGYLCNENIDSYVECAPCWKWYECGYERMCMKMISVERVLTSFLKVLEKRGNPLETQSSRISE